MRCTDETSQSGDLFPLSFNLPMQFCIQLLLCRKLGMLPLDLSLLFFKGIDQHDADLFVLDALNIAFAVASHQQRFDRGDLFGDQPQVMFMRLFPLVDYRSQPVDQIQSV